MDKQAWQKKKDKGYYKKSGETYEQRKRYHAKYMREWRELNVSMGLCGYCGVNPAELGSKCDDCKEYQRKYLRNNHDKAVKNNKHERKRLREGILEAYGNKCACCGEKQQEFLAIDHINNDGAEHRRSIGGGGMMYRWLKKHGYPEGFQILCQNCNWGKRLYGICPHQFKSS
jgi:hypothetical protein